MVGIRLDDQILERLPRSSGTWLTIDPERRARGGINPNRGSLGGLDHCEHGSYRANLLRRQSVCELQLEYRIFRRQDLGFDQVSAEVTSQARFPAMSW
jgi:hypothetical protein